MKREWKAGLGLLVAAALNGCSAASLSTYKPSGPIVSTPAIEILVVRPDKDERPPGRIGTGFIAWIPLAPYGHQTFPIGAGGVGATRPTSFLDDLTATVVTDLRASGVATTVSAAGKAAPFETTQAGDTLTLTLKEGVCDRYFTLYGMSIAGFFPWLIGAPTAFCDLVITFDAEVKDANGVSRGRQTFTGKAPVTEWLYTGPQVCFDKVPVVYGQISPQLRAFVAKAVAL